MGGITRLTALFAWSSLLLVVGAPGLPVEVSAAVDWVVDVDLTVSGDPLQPALLGHYDLSGELFAYDQEPGLVSSLAVVGFSDWRVGVGRWEASTWLLPELSDSTPCVIAIRSSKGPSPPNFCF